MPAMATAPAPDTSADARQQRRASRPRRIRAGLLCLLVGFALWLPALRLFVPVDARPVFAATGISDFARQLAARHLHLWHDPASRDRELSRMRGSNAEWDFMGRTWLVLSLMNMALREPGLAPEALAITDRILAETLRLIDAHGFYHFSMSYARHRPYVVQPARSLFVDGEVVLMIAARRLVAEAPQWQAPMRERVDAIAERMANAPRRSAESYPDECWTFDNANALAALRMADALDGSDHRALCRAWVAMARQYLVEPQTGLLISRYRHTGQWMDGPEGSSLWMVAHALQLVDPAFARDQYQRSCRELRRQFLGFDLAREWPVAVRGHEDIDSGFVVPGFDAGTASSGLAPLAARAFGDLDFYTGLMRSLELAAFPLRRDGALHYQASNQVGDAMLLYSTVVGPLWAEVERRSWR